MDAIQIIRDDHEAVKKLFHRYEAAQTSEEQQAIASQIIEELSIHAVMEEQLIYPALRNLDERLEDDVLNALEEHHVAKLVLAELDAMDADEERFPAKMHVLREAVESHIEEEEEDLLPRLEKLLTGEELEKLGEAILAAKEMAPTHPHPASPDTPPGNMLSGLVAKVSDAGKDLLRRATGSVKAEGHERTRKRAADTRAAASKKAEPRAQAKSKKAGGGAQSAKKPGSTQRAAAGKKPAPTKRASSRGNAQTRAH